MLNNLLIYRLLVVNFCGACLVAWATVQGYTMEIIREDTSYISLVIIGLFLAGLYTVSTRAYKVSKNLNALKAGQSIDVNSVKFLAKGEHVNDISNWLVTLGLLGTVIGFIMALASMDQGQMATAAGVQASIGQLVGGMKVAIYTTLVGAFFGLWLDVNRRILATATVLMLEDAKRSDPRVLLTEEDLSQ